MGQRQARERKPHLSAAADRGWQTVRPSDQKGQRPLRFQLLLTDEAREAGAVVQLAVDLERGDHRPRRDRAREALFDFALAAVFELDLVTARVAADAAEVVVELRAQPRLLDLPNRDDRQAHV